MSLKERKGLIWSLAGLLVGFIGAAAAIYPILYDRTTYAYIVANEPEILHVTENGGVTVDSNVGLMKAFALENEAIATGNSSVEVISIDPGIFDFIQLRLKLNSVDIQNIIVTHGAPKTLIGLELNGLERLRVKPEALQCFKICPDLVAELEVGIEFAGRDGPRWSYVRIPVCLIRDFDWDDVCK